MFCLCAWLLLPHGDPEPADPELPAMSESPSQEPRARVLPQTPQGPPHDRALPFLMVRASPQGPGTTLSLPAGEALEGTRGID